MKNGAQNKIPVSVSLGPTLAAENVRQKKKFKKTRLLVISAIAVVIAFVVSAVARLLIDLINLITNLSFFGIFSVGPASPAANELGAFVILIPVIGGVVVGLMALYGSKAIRGHGIPEAMEQILTNQSKIKPTIMFLKPLSAAVSIGTGGPFGAEGPIIATGGALGSTFGQVLKITHNERKILLAAGATAGMSAIFGSPVAAIFLAIELLLFEFAPRSIIPVALACVTGAAGHHLFFEGEAVFAVDFIITQPGNMALFIYSVMGIAIGLLSILVTKIVYWVEAGFEKLPVHWAWWPAIGGIGVGIVGLIAPRTLGVGYDNITEVLSGDMPFQLVWWLCLFKFISWAIALGSGTSGGTLAPLLTIGGGIGFIMGAGILTYFPDSGVTLPLAALVGMSALFAGASRALLTSIIFAVETTMQPGALLPLFASCTASYFVSFFFMEHTIMTEKIARRGVKTPHSYQPDILEKIPVSAVMKESDIVLDQTVPLSSAGEWMREKNIGHHAMLLVTGAKDEFKGVISAMELLKIEPGNDRPVSSLVKPVNDFVKENSSLRAAVELMAAEGLDALPVVDASANNEIIGILSFRDVISAYKLDIEENKEKDPHISIKRKGLKFVSHSRRFMKVMQRKKPL